MQEQITKLHLKILALCFAVKAKGHDAFYSYSGHVDWATVNIYLDGWDEDKGYDKQFNFLWTSDKDCVDGESINIVFGNLNECKDYLQNLLDGEMKCSQST